MPTILNRYPTAHVDYFALRDFAYSGTDYEKGDIVPAEGWRNVEALVRSHIIVAVATDRNTLPKMFLREIRSPAYVKAKYGFEPNVTTAVGGDFDPAEHNVVDVTDFTTGEPEQLGRVLVAEVAGKNRSTLVTALQTQALAMVTITPATGTASGGTATAVTGTSTNIDAALGHVTAVKFATTNGTSFSWTSGTGTLAATTPAHAAGAVNVTLVGFPGGDLVKTNGFTYT